MSAKVGRNDLCPCGSGKKYKKCCLALVGITEPSDDLFTRYNNLLTLTKIKLEQAYMAQIKKVRDEAKQIFLRYTTRDNLSNEYEALFSDWLWFDKTDSEDNTLGFHYLQVNGPHMDADLAACLSSLTLSYLSIYEVIGMEDEFLKVKDIFTDLEVKVLVKEAFDAAGSLLLARLVHLPEASIFSGMVLVMENEGDRLDFLTLHFNYLKELSNDTILNIFKFQGAIILGLFDHAYKKVRLNLNDIRYAKLANEERSTLIKALESNADFIHLYNLEDYVWFKFLNNDEGYARLAIDADTIILSAESIDNIYQLQGQVLSILPELDFTIINSLFIKQKPSLDYADMWFTIMKDQESDRWLNTPMEDIENRTPREFLSEENGQIRLLEKINVLLADTTDEQRDFMNYLTQVVQNMVI